MEVSAIKPNLGVFKGFPHFRPFELFGIGGIAVSLKTCSHEGLFVWCEECALLGPVHNEPVSRDSDEYSSYAFLRK